MRLAPFLEYLKDRAGDSLRAVEWYREDESELIYLRDDLDLESIVERANEIHAALTDSGSYGRGDQLESLGAELATVSLREEAALVHLPVENNSGIVIGLDPEVARDLNEFVHDCRKHLAE